MAQAERNVASTNLWLIGRATIDNMSHISPDYYSPKTLQDYQLGARYHQPLTRRIEFNVTYLPGIGKERDSDAQFVHDLDTGFNISLTPALTLSPWLALSQTPTYRRHTYSLAAAYRF